VREERQGFFYNHKSLLFWFFIVGFVVTPGVFFISWYGMYLNGLLNEEFNMKRWNLPSRIYSDTEVLYPGFNVYQRDLKGKLERIGYQEKEAVHLPGEYKMTSSYWDIYLNDFSYPYHKFKSYPLRIKLGSTGTIQEMINLADQEPVSRAEIEPELLATVFDEEVEDRSWVRLGEVPPHLIDAILSIEDTRFYGHPGIDPVGILRAFVANLRHREILQGGSTLTQQLIKNVLSKREKTFFRKLNEIFLALLLEAKYSKDEILELYLNEVYLGQRGTVSISGVKEAARYYFSKEVRHLSVAESALLAALLKAPNTYSPFQDPQKAKARRDLVLKLMRDNGKISEELYAQALTEELPVKADVSPVKRKKALKQAPYFVDYVIEQLKSKYPYEDLKTRGYKIFTTLDTASQSLAEEALRNGLSKLERAHKEISDPRDPLQGCLISIESQTGFIRALVGGRDYEMSQYNRAVQARRQPGSLFKPFVYLTAMDPFRKPPYTPSSLISDLPLVLKYDGKNWSPENYDKVSHGIVPLQRALEKSYNIATVRLALEVGLEDIIHTARNVGIKSPLEPVPSLALGAFEVTPLEIATAYLPIANQGIKREPASIRYVVSWDGEVVEKNEPSRERVLSPQAAYQVHTMLEGVMIRGTAYEARKLGFKGPAAGKTGTTNDFKDAWFVGYTPEVLTLVWVGRDQGEPILLNGAQAALPIWVEFMNKIDAGKGSKMFTTPPDNLTLAANGPPDCGAMPGCAQENPYIRSEDKNLVAPAAEDPSPSPLPLPSDPLSLQGSGTTLQSFLVCSGVQNREPVDCGERFSTAQGKIYTWMKVSETNVPAVLRHVYYYNGNKEGEVSLPIQYPSTRTWSSKDISSKPGEWSVAVMNESGDVLMTKSFVVE